jgi:AcrR family transcriptional regulator
MISVMQPVPSPTPPRQRAALVNERSRETRQALVRAALQLWSQGEFDEAYEASTASDIARAAGVSRGTFYFHFASKEDILLAMTSGTAQAMIDQIEAGMSEGVPLHALTEQVMASMARRVVRAPRAAALRAGTLGSRARAGEVTLTGSRLGTAFASLVRYGKERGELNAQVDDEETAAMLAAVTMEAVIRWGTGDRPESWLQQTLRDRAEVILSGVTHRGDR